MGGFSGHLRSRSSMDNWKKTRKNPKKGILRRESVRGLWGCGGKKKGNNSFEVVCLVKNTRLFGSGFIRNSIKFQGSLGKLFEVVLLSLTGFSVHLWRWLCALTRTTYPFPPFWIWKSELRSWSYLRLIPALLIPSELLAQYSFISCGKPSFGRCWNDKNVVLIWTNQAMYT